MNAGRWRAVAASQTGNSANRGAAGGDFWHELLFDFGEQARRAAQGAAHVAANMHLDFRRRRFAIMRKETNDLFNTIQRHGQPFAERDERLARQIAVVGLNLVEVLDDHSLRAALEAMLRSGMSSLSSL